MPIDYPFIERLRRVLGCPVTWDKLIPNPHLPKDLRIYWVMVATGYQADDEMRYYAWQDVLDNVDLHELRRIETNAEIWRSRAVEEYLGRVGFLQKLRFASANEYGKHFPPPGLTKDEIIARTHGADSLFFPEFIPHLIHMFWCAMEQALMYVVEQRPPHLYVQADGVIGASEGEPVATIRFDLDYGKPLIHGHPRLEIPGDAKLIDLNSDKQNFPTDFYDEYFNDIDEPPDQDCLMVDGV